MISFRSELKWMYRIFDAKCEQWDRAAYRYETQSLYKPFLISFDKPNQDKILKVAVCIIMYIEIDKDKKLPKHRLECTVNPPHSRVLQDIFDLFTLASSRYAHRFSSITINGDESYWETLTSYEFYRERSQFNELCKQYKIEADKKMNEGIQSKLYSILVHQHKKFSEKCSQYDGQVNFEVANSYQFIRGDKINVIKVVMTKARDTYKSLLENTTQYLYKATFVITPFDPDLEFAIFELFRRKEKPQIMFDEFSIY